jgi:undecaprenyl-diphosphatase
MTHLTYLEAAVVGLIQGVTELFPVSSLGHNVLLPALIGGSWARDLNVAASESPYLAFIVGLHVATAIALLIYFWRDWVRIINGFFSSLRQLIRPAEGTTRWMLQSADEELAWLIILATIPVGLVGLVFEHVFRVIFGRPALAAVFLILNGLILLAGERFRRRASLEAEEEIAAEREYALQTVGWEPARSFPGEGRYHSPGGTRYHSPGGVRRAYSGEGRQASPGGARYASSRRALRQEELDNAVESDERLSRMGFGQAVIIGSAQILALFAGISRDGVTMVAGMARGLAREDAARFAFLLATPVILAAGVLKLPDLMGSLGNGIHGQVLVGSLLSGVGAYLSVRYLVRYFQTRTLTPFGIYCLIAGLGSLVYLYLVH